MFSRSSSGRAWHVLCIPSDHDDGNGPFIKDSLWRPASVKDANQVTLDDIELKCISVHEIIFLSDFQLKVIPISTHYCGLFGAWQL